MQPVSSAPLEAAEPSSSGAAGGILPLRASRLCFEVDGQRLIDRISFTLEGGPRTILVGPNGAGKSLLLRLCHGLLQPTSGNIDWGGMSPAEARPFQAMVFQRSLLLRRSAAANVSYALGLKGVPRRERGEKVREALALAGLASLSGRPARVLSGGEQQRLSIARAWSLGPKVLFLDEPTASLDPAGTRAVEELVRAVHEGGAKVIMATHDLGQARRLGDEILFLHKGRLMEHTPAGRFFSEPQTPEGAAFVRGELIL